MSSDTDALSADAVNIAEMLWAAEMLLQDVAIPDEFHRRSVFATLATIRGTRQLLEKLAEKIDGTSGA